MSRKHHSQCNILACCAAMVDKFNIFNDVNGIKVTIYYISKNLFIALPIYISQQETDVHHCQTLPMHCQTGERQTLAQL